MNDVANYLCSILLAQTKAIQREYPDWNFYWPHGGEAYFEGSVSAGDYGQQFLLRLYVAPETPEVIPSLYVWAPFELPRVGGGTINEVGCSHAFHTLQNAPCGRVQICHGSAGDWDASMAYVIPVLKGTLWCEAYLAHLETGNDIANYFSE